MTLTKEQRSKIGKKSKRKGNKAQREVAKIFGLWFFNDPEVFHSTPASGGLRWSKMVAGTRGDVVASSEIDWPFSIEIKNEEKSGWDFHSLLLNKGPILKWWEQAVRDANEANKIPILVFTRNHLTYFTIMKESDFYKNNYINNLPGTYFKYGQLIISTLSDLLIANNLHKYNSNNHNQKLTKLIKKYILKD